jgi:hypothetical protein
MMIVFGAGASLGGPVSGWIADVTNWRWSFVFQVSPCKPSDTPSALTRFGIQLPFLVFSMVVVAIYLPKTTPHPHDDSMVPRGSGFIQALADFDFLGTLTLLVAISALLLGLSNRTAFLYAWADARVWGLLLTSIIATCLFLLVEWKVAINPVVPLQLFKGSRMPSIYASNFMLSVAAQSFVSIFLPFEGRHLKRFYVFSRHSFIKCKALNFLCRIRKSLQFNITYSPVFFTVILNTTSAIAGAHLLPNSIGLAVGYLLAGQ